MIGFERKETKRLFEANRYIGTTCLRPIMFRNIDTNFGRRIYVIQ